MFDFFKNLFIKNPFALCIGDSRVRALQLKGKSDHFEIIAAGQMDFPENTVIKGEIINEKSFSDTITELLAKTKPNPIEQKQCITVFPEAQTYEHIFHLPIELKGELLKKAVYSKISEMIPIPFDEIVFDMAAYALGQIQVVVVVAARKPVIDQYKKVLTNHCRLEPIVFEPESLSLLRNAPLAIDPNQGLILIYTNDTSTKWFSFWSGLIFDSNIISTKDADHIYDAVVEDVASSSAFFEETTKQKIGNILIVGKKENTLSLEQVLKKQSEIPVAILDRYKVNVINGDNQDPGQFCIVGGAALRGLQDGDTSINLLKK